MWVEIGFRRHRLAAFFKSCLLVGRKFSQDADDEMNKSEIWAKSGQVRSDFSHCSRNGPKVTCGKIRKSSRPDPTWPKSHFFWPICGILAGFRPHHVTGFEKSCQGVPSKSDLDPQGTKSIAKPRFWKVPNSDRIPGLAWLAWLALACLAFLASDRPRSPYLHLPTTARPPSAAGRRGAPLLLLLVQARQARPIRGEASQARQGPPHKRPVCFSVGIASLKKCAH